MKDVAVIMASYNGDKYIRQQIDSILNQQNVNVFILVRDDGSTDKTKEILNQYQRDGKLAWYTGEHLNVQKGYLDLMKKINDYDVEYIAFADQDDVWDCDKLYVAISKLEEFSAEKPSLYYAGQRLVDENLKFIENHTLNRYRTLTTRFVLSDFAGCTGVFNKKLLKEVLSYEPEYMLMHDTWILKVCLCLGGSVYVDPGVHMNYRQHDKNVLGLGHGFFSSLKQVKLYLFDYQVERQMHELKKGYSGRMIPEFETLVEIICNYRNNSAYKKRLLDTDYINFSNRGLNLTYKLKVLINKL